MQIFNAIINCTILTPFQTAGAAAPRILEMQHFLEGKTLMPTVLSLLLFVTCICFVSTLGKVDDDPVQNKLFYMYDLPEEYWWRWPADSTTCEDGAPVSDNHKEYSGIGKLVSPDDGLYLTSHWGMFSSLYNRFKRSKRRTPDPEKASMFIIPYDIGLDGYLNPFACVNRRQCTPGIIPRLNETLLSQKYFARNDGADHVLLWSLGQFHPWPSGGCHKFIKNFCWRCTITCYWMDSSKYEGRFVSLPFSSSFHWWEGMKSLPWDLSQAAQRNHTAVYVGSVKTLNPTNTKLRRAITQQCAADPACHWKQLGHSSQDTNIAASLTIYKHSVFCLCPPGDDPTRKAVVDIIVAGCIPVFFQIQTLYNQHPWHLTEQEVLDISVFIPEWMARIQKVNVMTLLKGISPDVIRLKQEALAAVAPRIQYAMPPPERLLDRYDNITWDPPFKDSVQLTIDGMFRRIDDVLHNRSTHIPLRQDYNWIWNDDYKNIRIQVPNITAARRAERLQQDALIRGGMLINQKAKSPGTAVRSSNSHSIEGNAVRSQYGPINKQKGGGKQRVS